MKVMLMMSMKMMMIRIMKTAGNIAVIKVLMKKIKVVTVRAMATITVMLNVFI